MDFNHENSYIDESNGSLDENSYFLKKKSTT